MTFTIKIIGIRIQTINGLENAVKQVDWTMTATEGSQSFELSQSTTVPDPKVEGFIALADLTEQQVIAWVQANEPRIPAIQAHIQAVLDRQTAKALLVKTPMPWLPVQVPPLPTE
jgi:hypothetical protein